MNAFGWLDDFLFDCVFQPFAHKFQRATGRTNFWLAKISAAFAFAAMVVVFMYQINLGGLLANICAIVVFLALYLAYSAQCDRKEKDFFKMSSDVATANEGRLTNAPNRQIFVAFTVLFSGLAIMASFINKQAITRKSGMKSSMR